MHRLKENSGKGRGRDKKRGLEEEGMKKAIRDKGWGRVSGGVLFPFTDGLILELCFKKTYNYRHHPCYRTLFGKYN